MAEIGRPVCPQIQADATISQANPVSTTLYTVLDTTKNARIIAIGATITWATTQPTPLEIIVTIDGVTIVFAQTDPISATWYLATAQQGYKSEATQTLTTTLPVLPFLLEGRSVKVQIRITWATTQPTPLVCRVKWAKW